MFCGMSASSWTPDKPWRLSARAARKSTLLNILGTIDRPTTGQVLLDEIDAFALSAKELAKFRATRIGFVFQDHHLLPQLTALENVLVARLAIGKVADEDASRAEELLKQVGLASAPRTCPANFRAENASAWPSPAR